MHLTEPDRKIIQAKHLNEREDDASRLIRRGWIDRYEEEINKDKGGEQVGRLYILVECGQVIKPILYHQGHVVAVF